MFFSAVVQRTHDLNSTLLVDLERKKVITNKKKEKCDDEQKQKFKQSDNKTNNFADKEYKIKLMD